MALLRQALEIVLETGDHKMTRVMADRHNFQEVFQALQMESPLVRGMGALMGDMLKKSLRW